MEKIKDLRGRVRDNYCPGERCISDCPYYEQGQRIDDDQAIEFIDNTDILEIEDYKKELGEDFVKSIINEWNLHEK